MRKIFFITLIFTINLVKAQIDERHQKNIKIIEAIGDLDKDGIAEKVEIWNTAKNTELGIKRELRIYKKQNSSWSLWRKYDNCLLASNGGGMMGDPLEYLNIEKGILIISQNGGSSWKWGYQDKYRFQNNEFELIGHSGQYGKECEYWSLIDFNISTGKIICKKEFQKCEDKYQQNVKKLNSIYENFNLKNIKLSLKNRYSKEIKIITPKHKIEYYL